jgi:hypothetical protein
MDLTIVLSIVAFLLLLFICLSALVSGEQKNEHIFLRLLLVFFFLYLFLLIGADNIKVCNYIENSTATTYNDASNFTVTHNYNYSCIENPAPGAKTLYNLVNWLIRLFWIYVFIYITYRFLQFKGVIKSE